MKDPYVTSGFMALQMAIEKSFVEIWTNPTLPRIADNVSILKNEIAMELTLRWLIRRNEEQLTRLLCSWLSADFHITK